jgi:hypothetical protein
MLTKLPQIIQLVWLVGSCQATLHDADSRFWNLWSRNDVLIVR